jgi:signal transduction histidine kinase
VSGPIGTFQLSDLVAEVARVAGDTLRNRPITLQIDCPPDVGFMTTNRQDVEHVLVELLSNASKFTKTGIIRLEVRREQLKNEDTIEFAVIDNGCGIPGDWLDRIFKPFEIRKIHQNRNGVGLSVVQGLSHRMGGLVSVTSELGKGSTFTVTLPAEISAARLGNFQTSK